MQIKALRWCSSNGRAVCCTLDCHRRLWISASSWNGLHWSKNRPLPIHRFISQHAASSVATHSFHFHSFSLGQMKLQQQELMSSLIVQNFWCPQQRRRPVSPSLPSMSSELLPVSFIISAVHPPLCLCLHLFYYHPAECFVLSLLSHSWTNSHWHVQKQVTLMSRFSFRFNSSCIWPISSSKIQSINL